VARIAEQLQKQAKNVVLTAITGKAAQTLQEYMPMMNWLNSCPQRNRMKNISKWVVTLSNFAKNMLNLLNHFKAQHGNFIYN
jgi:hypothetical protein